MKKEHIIIELVFILSALLFGILAFLGISADFMGRYDEKIYSQIVESVDNARENGKVDLKKLPTNMVITKLEDHKVKYNFVGEERLFVIEDDNEKQVSYSSREDYFNEFKGEIIVLSAIIGVGLSFPITIVIIFGIRNAKKHKHKKMEFIGKLMLDED